ncbi:hypothetical protein B296_00038242 [Ensete ventricosum]|uniref:Uncharacterized protein n=1 Tax=Ensete ventricosum TaxID=4639 RepID=A0A426X047_ENSVE|nr:hypothetical protein B296_00038242 [Ensete ventricosum]
MGRAPGPGLGGQLLVVELKSGGCVLARVSRRFLQEGAWAFIATVTGYPYLNHLSSLLLIIPLHLTMSSVVLAELNLGTNPGDLAEKVNSGTNPEDLAEKVNSGTNLRDLIEKVNSGTNPRDLAERVNSGINSGDLAENVNSGTNPKDSTEKVNSGTNPGNLAERVNSGTNPRDFAERVNSSTNSGDLAEKVNPGTNLEDLVERSRGGYYLTARVGFRVSGVPSNNKGWKSRYLFMSDQMDLGDLHGMPKMSRDKAPLISVAAPAREVDVSPTREAPKTSSKRSIDVPTEQADDPAW